MKLVRRGVSILLLMLLVGLIFFDDQSAINGLRRVYATSTKDKIDQTQKEKDELQNQHNAVQGNIDNLKGEQKTLKGQLNKLNAQLTEISENLADIEAQIADKEAEIEKTQAALALARETEETQYADMIARVRKMYERNHPNYFDALIGTVFEFGSYADALYAADGFERVAAYDHMKLDEFQANRELIEEQEAVLQQEKLALDDLRLSAEAEQNKVSGLIGQTSTSIADYAGQISAEEKKALEFEKQIKEKEKDLDALWKQLAEEMALSEAAAKGTWRDISEVKFAEGDRYLLANLIYCEAGGEPYEGQLAVGSVVINRVLSGTYPDSVVGVIYQYKQFSPVASGRLDLALASNKATKSCYQAADEAMAGVSNVGNCVYFRTIIDGLKGIIIGGHVFY